MLEHRVRLAAVAAAVCLLSSAGAWAEEPLVPGALSPTSSAIPDTEEGWQILNPGPIRMRAKARPDSPIPEMWVTATTGTSPTTVQEVLLDITHFPEFMPYIVEARIVRDTDKDGFRYVYAKARPPVVSARDYVTKAWTDRFVNPDGTGEFRTHWVNVDDIVPLQSGTVRLPRNEGVWYVVRAPDGATVIHYRIFVNPGGWLPGWLADLANRTAFPDSMKAVIAESQRRELLRDRARDAGVASPDAGVPAPDAGTQAADAGTPTPDAGAEAADAGTPNSDAGTHAADAGLPRPDAGTRAPRRPRGRDAG